MYTTNRTTFKLWNDIFINFGGKRQTYFENLELLSNCYAYCDCDCIGNKCIVEILSGE